MKNEKFLLDIQTKCGNIASEILNGAIAAEQTFKCKWPKVLIRIEESAGAAIQSCSVKSFLRKWA